MDQYYYPLPTLLESHIFLKNSASNETSYYDSSLSIQESSIDQYQLASAFCPDILFKCFPTEFINESCSYSVEGAVMIVDISGFSGYASELGSLGSEGLDKLQTITNDFLGQFVQCIYRYGGDGKLNSL